MPYHSSRLMDSHISMVRRMASAGNMTIDDAEAVNGG